MYKVLSDKELLYDPREDDLPFMSGKISLAVNTTGEFVFTLPPTHLGTRSIKKLTSVIEVYEDAEQLFRGRVLSSELDMCGSVTYSCEGELAYLLDSIQRPKEYHNLTPRSYLQDKIAQHNSQVEAGKRYTLGTVEKITMNYNAREDNQYTNTLDTIMDKLVKSNGGYLRVRHEGSIRYLDYLEDYGRTSLQTIRFGENILDLTEHLSAEDIITVLIPLGKAPEGAKEGERLTIASVNGGKDYLEDTEAIALYGRITGTNEWQDVMVPANLKTKGQEYLKNMRNLALTIELTAIDLHLIDVDIDRIQLGDMVRVVSVPHGLDRYMMVTKREYNLLDPANDRIVLGDTIRTLTEKQAALQKEINKQKNAVQSVEELKSSVSIISQEIDNTKEEVFGISGKVQVLESSATDTQQSLQKIQNTLNGYSTDIKKIQDKDVEQQGIMEEILSRLEILEGGSTS